ncbi:ParB/RepB/Spo0J family partition protein [Achromobacter insuavis]|uniref:ParB/RepB/Spo0J family partition protein n=1 Tax=Achromobacter insuavis TaxID=1287735 RepID=UPI001F12AE41|nr:ParB/RepB/Spo0J family partition protein [Achromobacter insuavis]
MKVSKKELEAIKAAAKVFQQVEVPLNNLVVNTEFQQRKKPHSAQHLTELAASIKAMKDILHNLVVVALPDGKYAVAAGGGRTLAMRQMADSGEWPVDFPVRCLVIPAELAKHASLIENDVRAAMHPADRFDAYRELAEQGKSADEIAAAHGASVANVRQLLALGQVEPSLLQLFRDDAIDLNTMKAFTLTTDHQRQLDAWAAAVNGGSWGRDHAVRTALTQDSISGTAALAKYVTIAAYEKAGGEVDRDLFAEGANGVKLKDVAKLQAMALEKMKRSRVYKTVSGESWGWVEVQVELSHQELQRYGHLNLIPVKLTQAQQAQSDALVKAVADAQAALRALEDDEDDDEAYEAAEDASIAASNALDEFDRTISKDYDPDMKANAGCILHLDYSGNLEVTRGLIRQEDRAHFAALQVDEGDTDGGAAVGKLPQVKTRPVHSDALVQRLKAQRTAAAQAELMLRPNLVLCMFVADMLASSAHGHFKESWKIQKAFDVQTTNARPDLAQVDPNVSESAAWKQVEDATAAWKAKLPRDYDALVDWLLQQPQDEVLQLQALLLSQTVYRGGYNGSKHIDRIASRIGLDMTKWWQPTAANYFMSVSKDRMADVLAQEGKEGADGIHAMKKADAAAAAELALNGSGWLPVELQTGDTLKEALVKAE